MKRESRLKTPIVYSNKGHNKLRCHSYETYMDYFPFFVARDWYPLSWAALTQVMFLIDRCFALHRLLFTFLRVLTSGFGGWFCAHMHTHYLLSRIWFDQNLFLCTKPAWLGGAHGSFIHSRNNAMISLSLLCVCVLFLLRCNCIFVVV